MGNLNRHSLDASDGSSSPNQVQFDLSCLILHHPLKFVKVYFKIPRYYQVPGLMGLKADN